jgi:single-stranded DNA-binding protein
VFVLVSGTLWRDPAARQSKATGKQFVTALLKSGTPTDTQWWNVIAFDTTAQAELLRLQAGDAVAIQGTAKLGVFEKNGEHRASLDVTAAHVLALRQPKPVKAKQDATPRQADDREAAPIQPEFDDAVPF